MSKVLDELREEMWDTRLDGMNEYAVQVIDRFESKHPGLVDLTACGSQCPAHWLPLAALPSTKPLCVVMHKDAPVGEMCPALPKGDTDA